jgi:hypothetical protein
LKIVNSDILGKVTEIAVLNDEYSLFKLLDAKSKKWEGHQMNNCLVKEGIYSSSDIYSIRDRITNKPFCTIEVLDCEIAQIKGNSNKGFPSQLFPVVEKALNVLGLNITSNDLEAMGYFKFSESTKEKILSFLHPVKVIIIKNNSFIDSNKKFKIINNKKMIEFINEKKMKNSQQNFANLIANNINTEVIKEIIKHRDVNKNFTNMLVLSALVQKQEGNTNFLYEKVSKFDLTNINNGEFFSAILNTPYKRLFTTRYDYSKLLKNRMLEVVLRGIVCDISLDDKEKNNRISFILDKVILKNSELECFFSFQDFFKLNESNTIKLVNILSPILLKDLVSEFKLFSGLTRLAKFTSSNEQYVKEYRESIFYSILFEKNIERLGISFLLMNHCGQPYPTKKIDELITCIQKDHNYKCPKLLKFLMKKSSVLFRIKSFIRLI